MMISLLFQDPLTYLMAAISILFAFSIHEYAHAQTIDALGDKTPRMLGRLSLNPLRHMDPMGMMFILLIGFGWGKPVPFNPMNFRDRRKGPILTALAGPLSNLALAILIAFVIRIFNIQNSGLLEFFMIFIWLNVILFVFNMIPIPPLDGHHIFFGLFGGEQIKMSLSRNPFLSIIMAILVMQYFAIPYVARPLFGLIAVGIPLF